MQEALSRRYLRAARQFGANDADHDAFDVTDVAAQINLDRREFRIGRFQTQQWSLAVVILDRRFIAQTRDHDLAISGLTHAMHGEDIAMCDTGIAHAQAVHTQQKIGARAKQPLIDRNLFFDVALGECGYACRDPAVQRQQRGLSSRLGVAGEQANATGNTRLEFQITLVLECAQMLINALAITQLQRLCQIGARRRHPMTRHELADQPQDLLLTGAQGKGFGYHTDVWYRKPKRVVQVYACNNPRMLHIESLTKRYGAVTALDNVSLQVAPGEFFGLLGPNGAGKSTLMSLVSGVLSADAGQILINGMPTCDGHPTIRQTLGLAPQSIALYQDMTALQNLHLFGELYGLRGATLRERVNEMLQAVQLTDRRHDAVKNLSGGMQRRLNLIAALLHHPKLLLCDEPTAGVDPQSRNAIFEFLQARVRAGLTIIYSTHYMEEAERLCTRIGIIDHGRIIALGTLAELLQRLPFEEEIRFPSSGQCAALPELLGQHGELTQVDGAFRFRPKPGYRLSAFYTLTESLGLPSGLFTSQRPTLEALFLDLTGQRLRE